MRLLICASEYYPHGAGIANVAYNIVKHLVERGHDCTVCSPRGPDIRLGDPRLIEKSGILGLLDFWRDVAGYIRHADYDALWSHQSLFPTGARIRSAVLTYHSTWHGEYVHGVGSVRLNWYKQIASRIERRCYRARAADAVFTGVSLEVCRELEQIGVPRRCIQYVPNGVDTQAFRPAGDRQHLRDSFGLPREDRILLSLGRLTDAKNHRSMIEIFSRLERDLDRVTLAIAGSGELLDTLRRYAAQLGVRNVLFLGHVEHSRAPALYACSDFYISTSKYEGQPLTLLEAMSSGLPCIVSDIPTFGIVKAADCGVVVDLNDTSVQDTLLDYIGGNSHRTHGCNARKYAVQHLDWSRVADRYVDLFRKVNA